MKKHLTWSLMFLFSVLLVACGSSEDAAPVASLELGKKVLDFKSDGGSQQIMVATNVEAWSVKSDKVWCKPTVRGSYLNVAVEKSTERLVREAVVTVTAGNRSEMVRVRQLGYEPAILLSHEKVEVPVTGGKLDFTVTTNVDLKVEHSDWILDKAQVRGGEMVTKEYSYSVKVNTQDAKRSGYVRFTEILPEDASKEQEALMVELEVVQRGLNEYNAGTGEDIKDDIKLKVQSGSTSSAPSAQSEKFENSYDGDYTTYYHSNWSNSGSNYFPITLTYQLEKKSDVDYLVYYPRTDGNSNGHFKQVEIQYSADGHSFQKLMDKDFKGSGRATKVFFDQTLQAKAFRFIVRSGEGNGKGFAACAEMEFYQKNPNGFDYTTLFTDETCSELKNGIAETDIEKCQFPFFKNMAFYMLKGKYENEFRIDEFKAYPNPSIQARTNKTNHYSRLDNPTGISVKEGESLIVFVGDTHGYDLGLLVQNLDKPEGDGFGGVTYPLSRGLNKLTMKTKGLVYVMYHTELLDDAAALPVKIHFATGTVNGYFDSQRHAGRWSELLGKATDKYFDVVGKYAHLTFETADFRKYAANNGDELVGYYDKIVLNEMELLGLKKYDRMFRNRLYLNVMYHSYMYATSYHTGYNQTTMDVVANPQRLPSSVWGPAHEIGHCNQTRPGVLWKGTTEVTNNIMSLYIQTSVFKNDSRIQTEDMGAKYRNRYSKAWTQIIAEKAPHCDFGALNKNGVKETDVFCMLVPFWQLELYFGRVLGQTPMQSEDKDGFYPKVYEYARTHNYNGMKNGDIQLDFVYNCCLASGYNLLEFFEKWGFLRPVNKEIDDYGKGNLTVTEAKAQSLRDKVNALGYPKLQGVALEYISDNTYQLYENKPAVVAGEQAVRTGNKLTIKGWQNVVAYEVKDVSGNLVFISSGETKPSNEDHFTLTSDWKAGYKLYAVSASGTRTEIMVR